MKKLAALGASALMAAGVGLMGATPAHAGYYCDGSWLSASWGRGCVIGGTGQVQDILTDGYCVHAAYYNFSTARWVTISGSTSCGSVVTFAANSGGDNYARVRMIRDDGRYLTLKWLR